MSVFQSTISFDGPTQLITSRIVKLRHIYGDDVMITADDKGWMIVDLSSRYCGEAALVQDNSFSTQKRKRPHA